MVAEAQTRKADGERETFRVGDKLPNAMTPGQLMRALELPASTFYMHQKAGLFKDLLLPTPIGQKRYSGRLVTAYLSKRK